MDAGLLDVLHDPAEVHLVAVVDRVDVDLDGLVEEPVDQHRMLRRGLRGLGDVPDQRLVVVDDLHAAPAKHVRGTDQDRVADLPGHLHRLLTAVCRAVPWRCQPGLGQHPRERPTILGEVNRLRAGAHDGDTLGHEGLGQAQRGLPAELDDDAGHRSRLALNVDHLEDVLEGQRLEVEPAGRVVVGGHGLGVAVDHDRVETVVPQGKARMDTGVVELDALPDAVRSGAQDDDGRTLTRGDLALLVIGRVVIRRQRRELGRAGVDGLVDGPHPEGVADPPNNLLRHTGEL